MFYCRIIAVRFDFDPPAFYFIGLQPTKTRAELDSLTVLIFETYILRVSPDNVLPCFAKIKIGLSGLAPAKFPYPERLRLAVARASLGAKAHG